MRTRDVYKYCLRCKSAFELREEMLFCNMCKLEYYLNPLPCNGLIIENSKGQILLVKRKLDPAKGKWDAPGGFVNADETMEEAMVREAHEELSVDIPIEKLKYVGSFTDVYEFEGIVRETLGTCFSIKIDLENLKTNDDADGYKWFEKKEINMDEIAFDAIKKALKLYLK